MPSLTERSLRFGAALGLAATTACAPAYRTETAPLFCNFDRGNTLTIIDIRQRNLLPVIGPKELGAAQMRKAQAIGLVQDFFPSRYYTQGIDFSDQDDPVRRWISSNSVYRPVVLRYEEKGEKQVYPLDLEVKYEDDQWRCSILEGNLSLTPTFRQLRQRTQPEEQVPASSLRDLVNREFRIPAGFVMRGTTQSYAWGDVDALVATGRFRNQEVALQVDALGRFRLVAVNPVT